MRCGVLACPDQAESGWELKAFCACSKNSSKRGRHQFDTSQCTSRYSARALSMDHESKQILFIGCLSLSSQNQIANNEVLP